MGTVGWLRWVALGAWTGGDAIRWCLAFEYAECSLGFHPEACTLEEHSVPRATTGDDSALDDDELVEIRRVCIHGARARTAGPPSLTRPFLDQLHSVRGSRKGFKGTYSQSYVRLILLGEIKSWSARLRFRGSSFDDLTYDSRCTTRQCLTPGSTLVHPCNLTPSGSQFPVLPNPSDQHRFEPHRKKKKKKHTL